VKTASPIKWDTSKRKKMLAVILLAVVLKRELLLLNELSLRLPKTGSPKEKCYREGDQE
jgi:hypothetical protein